MKLLAIDTATEACSAALWLDGRTLERFDNVGRSHTERLLPMVHALMADGGLGFGQLDGIVCGVGPGSFAGLRIATGFVKGLALARGLPVVGVSSLAMLAQRELAEGARHVLAAIDARMNEVYFGAFGAAADGLPSSLLPECVCAPEVAPKVPEARWIAVGSGWASYDAALRGATGAGIARAEPLALPHAADALPIAVPLFQAGRAISADELAPSYLRNKVALTLAEQAARRT